MNLSSNSDPIQDLLSRLHGAKKTPAGWSARCPAHEDGHASLSIGVGNDGRALLKCFAGCRTDDIVAAVGLKTSDLFPTKPGKPDGNGRADRTFPTAEAAVAALEKNLGKVSRVWHYQDTKGETVGVVCRWNASQGKEIRQASRNGTGWALRAMSKPRPLYRLPDLRESKTIYVCEGEKCADVMALLGLVSTTSAGGSQAASATDWTPLSGRDIVILRDNDKPGEKYAFDVAGILSRLTPATSVRVVALPGLADGEDVADLFERCSDDIARAALKKQIETLSNEAEVFAVDRPIGPEPRRPFPVEALPEPMRAMVKAVAGATGTDPSFAALAAIVVAAGCIGNRVAAIIKRGWTEPAVLWGMLVGKPGCAVKSPVLKLMTAPLYLMLKAERQRYREELERYAIEKARYDVVRDNWKASQRKGPASDPPLEPDAPIERRLVVSDVTIEKLAEVLEDNPLGLLLVRDELAAWLGAFDRYSVGGKGSDRPNWLSMFDAGSIIIDRKSGRGNTFVERAAVSVLGTIQPGILERCFGTSERESGLLARVLLAAPPDRPAIWTDAELPDRVAESWGAMLEALLAMPGGVDDDGNPRPRFIPISDDAKPVWIKWHNDHARESADIGNEDLAAHYAKLKGICVRLALVFTCIDAARTGDAIRCLGVSSISRGVDVVEWFKAEARWIYRTLGESDAERDRRKLAEWIGRKGGSATVRDVVRGIWQFKGKTQEAEAALNDLVTAGFGTWIIGPPDPKGGRPSKSFTLAGPPEKDPDEKHKSRRTDNIDTDNTPAQDPDNGGFVDVDEVDESSDWGEI